MPQKSKHKKKQKLSLLIIVFIIIAIIIIAMIIIDLEEPRKYLFVLSSDNGSLENNTLNLNNVSSLVIFSNRPDRVAGHLSLSELSNMWPESFENNPPNADLSMLENSNAVVELSNPKLDNNNSISFNIKIIKGDIPAKFGNSSLFINNVESSNAIENLNNAHNYFTK